MHSSQHLCWSQARRPPEESKLFHYGFLRPPPGARTRRSRFCGTSASSSFTPRRIVEADAPVARCTAAIQYRPDPKTSPPSPTPSADHVHSAEAADPPGGTPSPGKPHRRRAQPNASAQRNSVRATRRTPQNIHPIGLVITLRLLTGDVNDLVV